MQKNLCFEQCLDLDFIAKVAVTTWLWAALWLGITNYFGLFLFFGFFWGETLQGHTPSHWCSKLTVERLHLNRNWLLTGLFSSNPAVQTQLSVSLKKFGVPKYLPQCNWHGAQAHTWAVSYLWNMNGALQSFSTICIALGVCPQKNPEKRNKPKWFFIPSHSAAHSHIITATFAIKSRSRHCSKQIFFAF